jgi:hypothetical protein
MNLAMYGGATLHVASRHGPRELHDFTFAVTPQVHAMRRAQAVNYAEDAEAGHSDEGLTSEEDEAMGAVKPAGKEKGQEEEEEEEAEEEGEGEDDEGDDEVVKKITSSSSPPVAKAMASARPAPAFGSRLLGSTASSGRLSGLASSGRLSGLRSPGAQACEHNLSV